ncbi:MAG: hypothetical protein DLM53_00700 [Candidatus Eremiobacter antarcticus]|nr:MAG: hypothetical protein DLM53_00700 [Candidatus Eremiobacter sp. RRmetagenome_bin22]
MICERSASLPSAAQAGVARPANSTANENTSGQKPALFGPGLRRFAVRMPPFIPPYIVNTPIAALYTRFAVSILAGDPGFRLGKRLANPRA